MSSFRKALLWTAVPVVLFSLASVASSVWVTRSDIGYIVYLIALGLTGIAVVMGIVMAIIGRKQLAAGVLAGAGIGFVAQFLTCLVAVFASI